jgi:hypothetical protein
MPQAHYPSLFLLLNVHKAHWYRVNENGVEELGAYHDKKDTYEDHEGGFGRHGGEPDTINALRKEEMHHNLRAIAEETASLWKGGGFVHLTCAVPEQHKGLMGDELDRVLPGIKVAWLFGNYATSEKDDVRRLFGESLKVIHE